MVAPRLDLIFIVDFTLTAIFLVPQLLAWVYAHPEKVKGRARWDVAGVPAGPISHRQNW